MVKESELPILEIYHPSISAGDTAIIVTRDSNQNIINCVLIDLGCNTEEFIKWCEENISGFTMDKESTFDYVIVSHYHTDHYAGVNHKSIQTKCFISSHVSDKTRISKLNRNYKKSNNDASKPLLLNNLKYSSNINLFDKLGPIISPKENEKTVDTAYLIIDLGPPNLKNIIRLTCICANGIYKNENGNFEAHRGKFKDWNDHSIAWLLEYNGTGNNIFRYFTAGDLSGSDTGGYTDIESKLIPFLQGKKVNVLKATHHGSEHSLTYKFLETIKPDFIIVPCNNTHPLPFPQFFNRVQTLKDNNIIESKILIVNYMEFDINTYKQKGKGFDDLKTLNQNNQIVTGVTITNDLIYTAQKDINSLAELPCYLTTVKGNGKSNTVAAANIKLKITSPSHGEQNLPELCEDKDFAIESFNLVSEWSGLVNIKFDDVYTQHNDTKKFVQKQKVDPAKKKKLLKGFKNVFAPPLTLSKKGIYVEFLKNPKRKFGRGKDPSLVYLEERSIILKKTSNKSGTFYKALEEVVKRFNGKKR